MVKAKNQRKEEPLEGWATTSTTRLVALKLMYLGERYHGFASQGNTQPTVEGELFVALERTRLLLVPPSEAVSGACYSRCGRTDRGVNAVGQVVALRLRSRVRGGRGRGKGGEPRVGGEREREGGEEGEAADSSCELSEGNGSEIRESRDVGEGREAQSTEQPALATVVDDTLFADSATAADSANEADSAIAADLASTASGSNGRCTADVAHELDYVAVLNRVLPPDIRILGWSPVCEGFSARFSCVSREYRYYFPAAGLDLQAMQAAAHLFEGSHDFRNFCRIDVAKVKSFRRTISLCRVHASNSDLTTPREGHSTTSAQPHTSTSREEHPTPPTDEETALQSSALSALGSSLSPGVAVLQVVGSAFLWHQVRCMMAVLHLVGMGLEKPQTLLGLLDPEEGFPRKPQYSMAPPEGLVLHHCHFSREVVDFRCSEEAQRQLSQHMAQLVWASSLKSTIIGTGMGACPGFISHHGITNGPADWWSATAALGNMKGYRPLGQRPTEPSYEEKLEAFRTAQARKQGSAGVADTRGTEERPTEGIGGADRGSKEERPDLVHGQEATEPRTSQQIVKGGEEKKVQGGTGGLSSGRTEASSNRGEASSVQAKTSARSNPDGSSEIREVTQKSREAEVPSFQSFLRAHFTGASGAPTDQNHRSRAGWDSPEALASPYDVFIVYSKILFSKKWSFVKVVHKESTRHAPERAGDPRIVTFLVCQNPSSATTPFDAEVDDNQVDVGSIESSEPGSTGENTQAHVDDAVAAACVVPINFARPISMRLIRGLVELAPATMRGGPLRIAIVDQFGSTFIVRVDMSIRRPQVDASKK